ncbi:hypothetical protein GPOL_c14310 [Gordonia polyisoprenivorans VH2]|uniref:Uncharacterized protein n=1 Tax=Gordonia polyisoprenivorans (strain DSM 44266 / VH2) TaxID=1112204 RepID=H6MRL6_GORPV|nr:hypothetical protein [Gordonia polyisoprenivorans]AFA72482.1 hypothetical protein GPOL_c14310 [Gordonia polyisoprenivorans VH2]
MVDRIERNKDLIQELVESTATHVGQIATIITSAVADVAREIGEIVTDGFEMREAAQRAKADEAHHVIDAELADDHDEGALDAEDSLDAPAIAESATPDREPLNLEGSFEAPVVPQDLDESDPDSGADDRHADDTDGATLEGTMEAPVAPVEE